MRGGPGWREGGDGGGRVLRGGAGRRDGGGGTDWRTRDLTEGAGERGNRGDPEQWASSRVKDMFEIEPPSQTLSWCHGRITTHGA